MTEVAPGADAASAGRDAPVAGADDDDLLGSVLDGRYLVERVVGSGGFGVVYRAVHLQFDSLVAIKVLRIADRVADEERKSFIELFLAEGRLLFNLQTVHPSIVRVFETGTLRRSGRRPAPYLVMEWLDGLSLDREIKQRSEQGLPLPDLAFVIALLAPCVDGLAHAHRARIAHRDIKPGNIFLARQGELLTSKLLDFGLAKVAAESATTSAMLEQSGPGGCAFTPGYGAPEQWLSRLGATGPWTDVYSLALVCVELLCGHRALAGGDRAQLMASCLDDAVRPTPRALGVQVDDAVEAVFGRALALQPRERYRDVDAFWPALCLAAQVSAPLPVIAWEPWARARQLDRATGDGQPRGGERTALAASDWMQAETAPGPSYVALPQRAQRSAVRSLAWAAAGLVLLVAATLAARNLASQPASRPITHAPTERERTAHGQHNDQTARPVLANAPQAPAPPTAVERATAVPPVPVAPAHRRAVRILRSAQSPAGAASASHGDAPARSSDAGTAAAQPGAPPAAQRDDPNEPPAAETPRSLLNHDALSRRK